jgi:hypothetical protein
MLTGIYAASSNDINNDVPESYHLLRFYSDGIVLSTVVTSPDNAALDWLQSLMPSIGQWFTADNVAVSQGTYKIRDNTISFTTVNELGQIKVVIDHDGHIVKDTIVLKSYSYFNNTTRDNQVFQFIMH